MKKKIIIAAAIIIALAAAYIVGSGFMRATSVYISDYTVSDDGTQMTLKVGVASSVGYVRKVAVSQQQGGKLYLDCYCAFGGINGSIGARQEYTITLAEDTEMIAIFRSAGCYEEILIKDSNGSWQRAK